MITFIWSLVIFIVVVIGGLGLWIAVPWLVRWLADRGIFWFRLPEMHVCFILKDKKLHKIYVACSNENKRREIEQAVAGGKYENYYEYVDEGLVWIGLPWLGYELHSWYELSEDDDNPEIDPHYILYLGERTWDYKTPEDSSGDKDEFINEWGVDTADPIQVTPKLVSSVEVLDPAKAVFDVKYFQEAILKEILTGWRNAVKELEYFTYSEVEEQKTAAGASGTLHTEAQKNLNKFLFGLEELDAETSPEQYASGSPGKMFAEVYGIWQKRVRIRDIDPTESKVRDNLQAKLIAQTEAAADVEKAKGKRDSQIITADGQIYETQNVGEAEAKVIKMKLSAKGNGLANISKKLKLKKNENKILYAADMAIQMAKNSQYTYLAGMPGDIGTWIMAAADQMRGGMRKVKSETDAGAQMGFAEVKKAFSGLKPNEQEELLKLAEKTAKPEE